MGNSVDWDLNKPESTVLDCINFYFIYLKRYAMLKVDNTRFSHIQNLDGSE